MWFPGGTISQLITVNSASTYIVSVTDSNGCVGVDSVILDIDTLPVVNLGNDISICANELTSFDAGPNYSYLWTPNGDSSQIISNLNTTGLYGVTITDGNNCSGSDEVYLTIDSLPVVELGPDTTICDGDSVLLDAKAPYLYSWGPNGENSQILIVKTPGVYFVDITNEENCTGRDSVEVFIDTIPYLFLGNDTSICADVDIIIDAGLDYSYEWFPGGETTQEITVNSAGGYAVLITDGNNCQNYDQIVVLIDALPLVDLGKDTSICIDSEIVFDAGNGESWLWNTGDDEQILTVNSANTFSVELIDENGCVGKDTVNLSIDTLPEVYLGFDVKICADTFVDFNAGIGFNYLWTPNGETSQEITGVKVSGTYGVVITDGNDCIGSDSIELIVDTIPYVNLGSDTSICFGDSALLDAGSPYLYSWNPLGEIAQTIWVKNAGVFMVEVTDEESCRGRDTVEIFVDTIPDLFLGNDTSICADNDIVLNAGLGYSYQWFPTGETFQAITVNTAGGYGVVITDGNDCQNYDQIIVLLDTLPIINIGPDTSICIDSSLVLDAQKGVSWLWNTTEITKNINVNTSAYFDVVVTDGNGCKGRDTINVGVNQLPVVNLGNDTSICFDSTIVFNAGNNSGSWLWNTSSYLQEIVVNIASGYSVIVTDTNGCVGYDTVNLSIDTIPFVFLGNDTSICADSTLLLDAQNIGGTFLWNTNQVSNTILINTSGEYSVTVITSKGCVGYDTISLNINDLPLPYLGIDSSLCQGDSMELSTGLSFVSLLWAPSEETTETIMVDSQNFYEVMVIDTNNCVGYDTVFVSVDDLPITDLVDSLEVCKYLDAELIINDFNAVSFSWNTGEQTQSIFVNSPGSYFVDVVNVNNCFNSDTVVITQGPELSVTLYADSVVCDGDNTDVTVDVDYETGSMNYTWSTLESSSIINVVATGQYSVLAVDEIGCWGADTIMIRTQDLPTLILSADTVSICSLEEADERSVITATHNGTYVEWGDGFIGNQYITEESGWFEASVYDEFQCFSYDSITISEYCRPINITLPNIFTPDGDGANDGFIPFEIVWEDLDYMLANLKYIHFKVYNRWGGLIHLSTNVIPKWSGFDNNGFEAPDGTYFWILQYEDIDGGLYNSNGYVKLKR